MRRRAHLGVGDGGSGSVVAGRGAAATVGARRALAASRGRSVFAEWRDDTATGSERGRHSSGEFLRRERRGELGPGLVRRRRIWARESSPMRAPMADCELVWARERNCFGV